MGKLLNGVALFLRKWPREWLHLAHIEPVKRIEVMNNTVESKYPTLDAAIVGTLIDLSKEERTDLPPTDGAA